MKSVAFVQLGRHGDIVNILPIMRRRHEAGERVVCYVHENFAGILEGAGYVEPVICGGSEASVREAYRRAIADGHDEVIAAQVNGAFQPPPAPARNYTLEQWLRAGGKLGDYHVLPLVFDKAPAPLPRVGNLPRVGVSLNGFSSAFERRAEFKTWLLSAAPGVEIVDLDVTLSRVIDLLPLIDSCDLLIAIDSLPLHLGYAGGIPTIALQCDAAPDGNRSRATFYRSEPRPHWVASMTYEQAMSPGGQAQIAAILGAPGVQKPMTPIIHLVNWFEPTTADELLRMNRAKASWRALDLAGDRWITLHANARQTSRDLGDSRSLPFIRDLLDSAASNMDDEILVLTNADSIISPDAPRIIRQRCAPCCLSRRIDITPDGTEISGYRGVDLFACRADWWKAHRDEYPDMLHGAEAWDGVMWQWFADHNPDAEIDPPLVRHVLHKPFWSRAENLKANIGQRWNRAQATLWMIRNGKQAMFGEGDGLIR